MRTIFLASLLFVAPVFAQSSLGGEESVFRRAQTHQTTTPSARRSSGSDYIGPLKYNGVQGAIINNKGDSRAARARINQKKIVIAAEQARGYEDPVEYFTVNGQPVANTAKRNNEWYSDSYYQQHEDASRVRLDAWTFQRGFRFNAFVLSCVYDRETQTGGSLKFFIKGLEPVGAFGSDVKVDFKVRGRDAKRLTGRVSHVESTNIHIDGLSQDIVQQMRNGRDFTVTFRTMANPQSTTMTFSLMGFTAASTNTIANCTEGVQ